jgi:hypothetical protein
MEQKKMIKRHSRRILCVCGRWSKPKCDEEGVDDRADEGDLAHGFRWLVDFRLAAIGFVFVVVD